LASSSRVCGDLVGGKALGLLLPGLQVSALLLLLLRASCPSRAGLGRSSSSLCSSSSTAGRAADRHLEACSTTLLLLLLLLCWGLAELLWQHWLLSLLRHRGCAA
jgi:hypothetical protein